MTYRAVVLKKVFILFFIGFAVQGFAQNKDYLVEMNGIGQLKIGMSQEEIEKLLKQKFILRNALDTAVSHHDTATAKYKNSNVQLFFQRQYTAENTYSMYLMGLKTKSPLCKTEKGIGIGSEKLKIIAAYETDFVSMRPEYEDEEQSVKSKTKYVITIINDSGERRMVFYLRNKKTKQKTLLAVFAHPDDEGAIGSAVAKYARTHKVYIIIATDGRYGVREHAGIPEGDSLAAVRKKEMECACGKLGVQPPILLGFHDGMGMRIGVGEAFKQIRELTKILKEKIDSLNPAFIITFGPDGDTGHPDHRMIGNITTEIILKEGWDRKYPLYYLAWTKEQSDAIYPENLNYMNKQYLNVAVPFEDRHEAIAWEALKCHKSQLQKKKWMNG